MSKRKILVLESPESPWPNFLREFFEDTSSVLDFEDQSQKASPGFNRARYDAAFVNPALLTLALAQKIKVCRQSVPAFRVFALALPKRSAGGFPYDEVFDGVPALAEFQKRICSTLPMPERIRVLVVDDEKEIGQMVCDFLDRRVHPTYDIECVYDGQEGLRAIERKVPDVLILDIKMPVMDGRKLYRTLRAKGLNVPTIIFFDAISGDEMIEIRKYGKPAVVEKGSSQSAMPEMMTLIQKMIYFG